MPDDVFQPSERKSSTDGMVSSDAAGVSSLLGDRRVLETFLSNLPGMAYRCCNDDNWTMQFVSGGCRELTGYNAEDLLRNRAISYEQIIHPDDRSQVRLQVGMAMAEGRRFEITYRIVTATGETRWVLERGLAIRSRGAEVDFIEGIIIDINSGKRAELQLKEREQMLTAIIDQSFQFIGLLDTKGCLLRANQSSMETVGVRWEDIAGKAFWETPWWMHSPVEQAKLRDGIVRASQGEFVRFETTHHDKTGRVLVIDFSLKPVRDEMGRVVMIIPEGRDITDYKNAQEALRLSEEKFYRAFVSSPNFILIARFSDGKLLNVNERFARQFNISMDKVEGLDTISLGIWKNAEERDALMAIMRREGRVRDFRKIVNLADGSKLVVLVSMEKIVVKGQECLLTTAIDITHREEVERALRESEEKFAKAFRGSPYSLMISDIETGKLIEVNAGFESLSGYRRDEAIGRSKTELGLWQNPADRVELVRRLTTAGTVRGMELDMRTKSGERVSVLCNCELIELGDRLCMLSILDDVTDRRRVERERELLEIQLRQNQKMEALGTMAGGIAHDFNNILTAIMVNQQLALMDIGRPEEAKRRLVDIDKASKRAKELVRQILTFSRQQPSKRVKQPLQPIIKEALGLVRSMVPTSIEMSVELSEKVLHASVDATHVHQIVMNLCTNAAYAMKDGPGLLTVKLGSEFLGLDVSRFYPGLKSGHYARLTVEDTGHGMDEDVQSRIFEPFFTTKEMGEGTGLGLSVVHGIMRDYEGGVYVKSQRGKGTTFDLFFPEASESALGAAIGPCEVELGKGESVLLVDDEQAICDGLADMLLKIGYRVERFTNPLLALDRFRANPFGFDLLITDRTMPQLSGKALIAQVQRLRPIMPALLLSGLNSPVLKGTDDPVSIFEQMSKPPDIQVLSVTLRRMLATAK